MYTTAFYYRILLLMLLLSLSPRALFAEFSLGQEVDVTCREAKLRASPSHWSAMVAELSYGDRVKIVAIKPSWVEADTTSGTRGFLHSSAVTVRRIVLSAKAGGSQSGITASDVVLAGKGFNEDVENSYKSQDKNLDFSAIDSWEGEVISDHDLERFVIAGSLAQ